jgi:hypothetical protein
MKLEKMIIEAVRENPISSIAVGLAVGFLIAQPAALGVLGRLAAFAFAGRLKEGGLKMKDEYTSTKGSNTRIQSDLDAAAPIH